MDKFKTYNLKLNEESYFKLREIETSFEKKFKKKLTKGEVINQIIDEFEL